MISPSIAFPSLEQAFVVARNVALKVKQLQKALFQGGFGIVLSAATV